LNSAYAWVMSLQHFQFCRFGHSLGILLFFLYLTLWPPFLRSSVYYIFVYTLCATTAPVHDKSLYSLAKTRIMCLRHDGLFSSWWMSWIRLNTERKQYRIKINLCSILGVFPAVANEVIIEVAMHKGWLRCQNFCVHIGISKTTEGNCSELHTLTWEHNRWSTWILREVWPPLNLKNST
jgi:hypothetical protein